MKLKLTILGGGESGIGAALLGVQKGYDVFLSDSGALQEAYKTVLESQNIAYEAGQHSVSRILEADLVVKSPGIPDTVPLVKALRAKGTSVISEIEFAARYTAATIIGITGSNGKTTTSLWAHHMLKKAGFNVGSGGKYRRQFRSPSSVKKHTIHMSWN